MIRFTSILILRFFICTALLYTDSDLRRKAYYSAATETRKFIEYAESLEKLKANAHRSEAIDGHHVHMIDLLEEINLSFSDGNSYQLLTFLYNKGLETAVLPYLLHDDDEIKTLLLITLKNVFIVHKSDRKFLPMEIIDKLLKIFEKDNLAMKAHALDVLQGVLINNLQAQARVMQVKGLKPFYEQIMELDSSLLKQTLDLFNNIILEHVKFKENIKNKRIRNAVMIKLYQSIGLLESISTPRFCNGLLNVLIKSWNYHTKENGLLLPVIHLIKNVHPYCFKKFIRRAEAVELFDALDKYINDPKNEEYLKSNSVDLPDIKSIIEIYVNSMKYLHSGEL